jgi:GDPmannose 4,6-dehydratase
MHLMLQQDEPDDYVIATGHSYTARNKLGWEPRVGIDELVRRMVAHDLELARQERTLREAGHTVAARGMAGA